MISDNNTPIIKQLNLAWRFSRAEMRGGLSGFIIFIACIALGVGAIGGVNSVSQAIVSGVEDQGQEILGADVMFKLVQREVKVDEQQFLDESGDLSLVAKMRSMARLPDGSDQTLVELKAVDGLYPLYGELKTSPPMDQAAMFGEKGGVYGAIAPQLLYDRLGLKVGERLALGEIELELRGLLDTEPDMISDGFGFAPRLMISLDAMRKSGLIQPGSLVSYLYKVRVENSDVAAVEQIIDTAKEKFPQAGWSIRDRSQASPALTANIDRFAQFLTLVGLTALVVGGVGVANAVRAYLDSKRQVIAAFKCLGASGRFVFTVYLMQILLISIIAIIIGLIIAALMPLLAAGALANLISMPSGGGIYPASLAMAALFGILIVLTFALIPLGQARDIPATALFRAMRFDNGAWPRPIYIISTLIVLAVLVALAVITSFDKRIAISFLCAIAGAFLILRIIAILLQKIARSIPSVRSTPLRMALGNIHRPGALTPSVVLSLGLGLTLLVAIALVDGNLRQQISGNLSERAPNFFFVDIQKNQVDDFTKLIKQEAPTGKLVKVPMLRGRIIELNGRDVTLMELPPEGAWVLRGERGLTYAKNIPENSTLKEGEWWPADYSGEPLVSFAAEEAGELGLKVGDRITVNILGRNVTAKIANLRQLEWESLAINFVMVFSPNTLAGAPHAWIATLLDKDMNDTQDAALLNSVTRQFPGVTSLRVRDALEVVNALVSQLATAIRAAASVALIASVLVLSGALAAGNRTRTYDSVILKMLGATRKTLITAFSLEYMMIGLATGLFALLAGGVAAWFVVSVVMQLPWVLMPQVALMTLVLALVLTVGFGLIGTWRVLGQKAAPILRDL